MSDVLRVSWFERDPGGGTIHATPAASSVRLRRHTDGRVALITPSFSVWNVYTRGDCRLESEEYVTGPGWSELLVAEPPEPDHHTDGTDAEGNDTCADQWEVNCLREVDGVITAWTNGIEIEGVFHDIDDATIEELELDALKLLAAIAEHRRCCERERARQKPEGAAS